MKKIRKKTKIYRVIQYTPPGSIRSSSLTEEASALEEYRQAIDFALLNPGLTRMVILQVDEEIVSSFVMGR